mgnify:CR=1 FL=1
MKKKQVALLLAALMCITPVAESAAVMGAEFSSGEETVEMQGTEEEAEAEDTAEIWTSGEEDGRNMDIRGRSIRFWYGRSAGSGRIYIRRIRGIDRRSRC